MTPAELRKKLNLTQKQLALLLGMHDQTISKWERGTVTPGPYHQALLNAMSRSQIDPAELPMQLAAWGPIDTLIMILREIP